MKPGFRFLSLFLLGICCLGGTSCLPAERPQRVVSLLPSLTEVVQELGAEAALVGVSDHCQIEGLPRLGGLDPDVAGILALWPDLVLADASQYLALEELRRVGVRVEIFMATGAPTVEERLAVAERVGVCLGRAAQGKKFAESIRSRLRRVAARVAGREMPGVVYIARWNPLKMAAGEYVEHDIIRLAGGRNLGAHLSGSSAELSDTELFALDPDVLLVSTPQDLDEARKRWPHLRAVRQGGLHALDLRHHPGTPHSYWFTMPEDVERLAGLLHP